MGVGVWGRGLWVAGGRRVNTSVSLWAGVARLKARGLSGVIRPKASCMNHPQITATRPIYPACIYCHYRAPLDSRTAIVASGSS
ncbi:hypothetical protein E2C01_059690 [Portunus trituberculatus]|uniref:Uncharacterized protein n=1 Tax=Portunus trituberculatus TaxID=210409 RepID=A0A5B7H398_PORTR|nr:hypothetical protein [Portunus trituberculatus]